MERQVTNIINFGLGCLKAISGGYAKLADSVSNTVSEIITEGEKSENSVALRIREMAHKATDLFSRGEKTHKTTRAA